VRGDQNEGNIEIISLSQLEMKENQISEIREENNEISLIIWNGHRTKVN
jgi:hypothetical protein